MKNKFLTTSFQIKVEKPWGHELILTQPDLSYTGKILHLNSGCRFSLQFHDQKTESLTLTSGEAVLTIEDGDGSLKEIKMELKRSYLIRPFQKHRVKALKEADILETSTSEKGNTVRLEDDYSRPTETPQSREEERKRS